MSANDYLACRDLAIRQVEAIPVAIPMVRPIKWARGEIKSIDNVVVVVTLSDGTQGIADAPPRPTIYGETQQSLVAIIRDHLAPALVGINAFDMARVWSVFDALAWNPAAKAALDMAIVDAQAKRLGVSCAQLLGGTVKRLPLNWRLSMAPAADMVREAERMMAQYGFRAFKVKCGVNRATDREVLTALRKLVGSDV
ncbi:MAG TPA: hypothetical protein VNT02_03040, partial [Burkholderiales bacterium]|nr:hypothetical protein [Burkholderiales bacterium]